MTPEELAHNDGKDGRKALVAVNGTVYDFSASPLWQNGNHQDSHLAGRDLTEELRSAPHVRAVIERYPVVGSLELPLEPPPTGTGKIIGVLIVLALLVALFLWLR